MNHSDVQNRIADYLEGDLSLARRALFDAHLDHCETCRVDLEELRAIPYLLKQLPDVEPPPMLAADVMRRIRLGEATPTFGDRIRSLLSEIASPGIAIPVAAMGAVFVLAVTSGQFQLDPLSGGPQSPSAAAGVRTLATIPPEAAAVANRVFRPAPGAPTVQLYQGGDGTMTSSRRRAFFQLLPASAGESLAEAGVSGSSRQRVRIVVRPSLGTGFSDVSQGMPRTPDDWLAVVQEQPAEFARRQASLSLAEREHWVRVLARRAVEVDSAGDVVRALHRRGGPEGRNFARAFAAEARLASSQIATSN